MVKLLRIDAGYINRVLHIVRTSNLELETKHITNHLTTNHTSNKLYKTKSKLEKINVIVDRRRHNIYVKWSTQASSRNEKH